MIEISNLRKIKDGAWTKVVADIKSDVKRMDSESVMWVGVENEHQDILESNVYNMFLFLPVYMGMYYHTDLHIHGSVSKTLYKNIDYIQGILSDFSKDLNRIRVTVDGYAESEGPHNIVGTGISCGVDCLQTVYSKFVQEQDEDYKINTLFNFNCGWHGYIDGELTNQIFRDRCKANKPVADELGGMEFIAVDSNLHAFLPKLGDAASYFCIYSCIFALERGLKRYYISSSFSYGQVIGFGKKALNRDFSEFGDPLLIPLAHSEKLELVSDGGQYKRSEKLELIADWPISKKYLNVCCKDDKVENCSVCHKCIRTLLPLEAMGLLDEYSSVFDLNKYKKLSFKAKCRMATENRFVAFQTDNYEFCKKNGMKIPNVVAHLYFFPEYFVRGIRKIKRTIFNK